MARKARPVIDLATDFFKDRRVDVLAARLGLDLELAQIRLIKLWCWCRDEGTKFAIGGERPGWVVPDSVLRGFLGPHGPEAMLADGCEELALGLRTDDGRIYLCGSEDTVRALLGNRAKAAAGGRARAARAARDGGRFTSPEPARHQLGAGDPSQHANDDAGAVAGERAGVSQPGGSPEPARHQLGAGERAGESPACDQLQPASYLLPLTDQSVCPDARAREPEQLVDYVRIAEVDAWSTAAMSHRALQASGIDRGAPAYPPIPVGEGQKQLRARILELAPTRAQADHASRTIAHVVSVRHAEAERTRSLRWFTPTNMWSSTQFWRAAEMSLADAQRGDAPKESKRGPASTPAPNSGRAEPQSPDAYAADEGREF